VVDPFGQVIDVLLPARRDAFAARRVLTTLVLTDAAAMSPAVLADLIPAAWHQVEQSANNPVEADHSRLEHRLPADVDCGPTVPPRP
jgi:IS6 family transposase